MIPACRSKPSRRALNTCQVCGVCSTRWKEWSIMTVREVPLTSMVSRTYSPAGMIQESTAQSKMTEEMMVYVCGIRFSIVVFLDKVQSYAIYL